MRNKGMKINKRNTIDKITNIRKQNSQRNKTHQHSEHNAFFNNDMIVSCWSLTKLKINNNKKQNSNNTDK